MPYRDVERIISAISVIIVISSFFVYRDLNSVLLCVVEIFVCERVTTAILRTTRNAVRFEVITSHPEEIGDAILYQLGHGATLLRGNGLYSGEEKSVIVCVVNHREIPDFLRIISAHPDTFVFYADVSGVHGNFDRQKLKIEPK